MAHLNCHTVLKVSTVSKVDSGDGRTRTAVQTLYPIAFYTFILPLLVGNGMPEDGLVRNLSSGSWRALKESTRASGLDDTPYAMKDRPES